MVSLSSFNILLASWLWLWVTLSDARLVRYRMKLTWEVGAPNGVPREMIKINGGFPGPNIIVHEGDDVEVIVINKMPFNTSIHWHGIEQRGTPWSDGAPGLTQRPIEPGESYLYRFNANTYGTYWYHAHSRGTLQDGLYGAIYVHPKDCEPRPFHLISQDKRDIAAMIRAEKNPNLVLVSDWTNFTSEEYMYFTKKSGMTIFCSDSILTNGKGSIYCPGTDYVNKLLIERFRSAFEGVPLTDKGCFPPVFAVQGSNPFNYSLVPFGLQEGCIPSTGPTEVFKVHPRSEWASFNFIAGTSLKTLRISIDEHPMWVYEVDGHYIEPQLVDSMIMFNGERYSVMVRLDKKPGEYTMRISDSGMDQVVSGFATMQYRNAPPEGLGRPSIASIDYGGQNVSADVRDLNVDKLIPFNTPPPAYEADITHFLNTGRLGAAWKWSMNGKELYASDRSAYQPLLYYPNSTDAQDTSLTIGTKNGTWVDIIIQIGNTNNTEDNTQFPHVVHKHGNKMYKIGKGLGHFNWTSVAHAIVDRPKLFNLVNPPYRDSFLTTDEGIMWIAIRYHVVIPGPFLLHCHFENHLEGGMAVVLMDGVDKWPTVPPEYQDGKVDQAYINGLDV